MPPKQKQKQKAKKQSSQDVTAMVKSAVRSALKAATPHVAPKGNSFLGDIGQFAGNGISKIFGLGAYKISKNSLYSSQTGAQVPFMHSQSESVIFRHREYIGDILSTTAFNTSVYPVNPGLSSTFPYLSTIASCFQEYRFRGLIFEFKSTGADALVNGTNTSLGTVGLVAQYRADAPVLNTKVEFLNEMWSTDCKTSENTILPVECAPKENAMAIQYIRTGPPTGDIKMYDLCNVTVATNGSPGNNVVGELWASYEIELFKPTVTPSGGVIAADYYTRSGAGATLFGTIQLNSYVNIGVTFSSNTITFPINVVGRFLINVYVSGTAAVLNFGLPTTTNSFVLPLPSGSTMNYAPAVGSNSATVFFQCVLVIPLSAMAPATISFPVVTLPTTATTFVFISEVNDSLA